MRICLSAYVLGRVNSSPSCPTGSRERIHILYFDAEKRTLEKCRDKIFHFYESSKQGSSVIFLKHRHKEQACQVLVRWEQVDSFSHEKNRSCWHAARIPTGTYRSVPVSLSRHTMQAVQLPLTSSICFTRFQPSSIRSEGSNVGLSSAPESTARTRVWPSLVTRYAARPSDAFGRFQSRQFCE
jgi:hypothetical protein